MSSGRVITSCPEDRVSPGVRVDLVTVNIEN